MASTKALSATVKYKKYSHGENPDAGKKVRAQGSASEGGGLDQYRRRGEP